MFITFEGLDGAGKSTQIDRLRRRLLDFGQEIVCTREPGGTALGDRLRAIVLNPAEQALSPETEVLLYATSRSQLLEEVIRPGLAAGKVVICDRYVDASLAYQGAGLGLPVEAVWQVNLFATRGLLPDVTFLFDLPVETSMSRVTTSRIGSQPDRIERRTAEYFNRVRSQFLQIAKSSPNRVQVLDASKREDELEQEIWQRVSKLLGLQPTGHADTES